MEEDGELATDTATNEDSNAASSDVKTDDQVSETLLKGTSQYMRNRVN